MLNDVHNSIQALREPIRQNICCFENVFFKKNVHMELIRLFGGVQAAEPKRSIKTFEDTILP